MRLAFTAFLFILQFSSLLAQDASELAKRNGFKSIKLGTPIDSVKGATFRKDFLEKDEFPAKLYETTSPEYMSIGEVAVQRIQLMTYKQLVYKIIVNTDKDARVMKALEKSYGKAIYVVRTSSYSWKAQALSLTFVAHKGDIELTYRCYPVYQMMLDDKGKKLNAIAEEF